MRDNLYEVMADAEHRHWWFIGKNANVWRLIERFGPDAAPDGSRPRALDAGCGSGGLLSRLGDTYDAVGIDMAEEARDLCAKRGLKALYGSLPDEMPFEPGSFDLIVASEVIEHVEQDVEAAKTLVNLLAPGGVLIVTVPAFQWMWGVHDTAHHHFRRYTRTRLLDLFRDQPVRAELASYHNTTFFPLMAAARLWGKAFGSKEEASVELKRPPAPINATMGAIFKAEGHVINRVPLPFGGSLIAAFRRDKQTAPAGATVTVTSRGAQPAPASAPTAAV